LNYSISNFGRLSNGLDIDLIKVENEAFCIEFINYGAAIKSIIIPDKNGSLNDIVLGYNELTGYVKDEHYLGFTIGPVANRIEDAKFKIGRKEYQLEANDGKNHLHGGIKGFHKQVWKYDVKIENEFCIVNMYYTHWANESNYPADLDVHIQYKIEKDFCLKVTISAKAKAPTPVNITLHPYFNLNQNANNILNHHLKVKSKQFTPLKADGIPIGHFENSELTACDLNEAVEIGAHFKKFEAQLKKGFDHNLAIDESESNNDFQIELSDIESGRKLEISTNQSAVQLYSGYYLNIENGKGKKYYKKFAGIAIEPQMHPNSVNNPTFGNILIDKNTNYIHKTTYQFGLIE